MNFKQVNPLEKYKKLDHIIFTPFRIMESSLTLNDMINNPDILLSAVNEVFACDTTQQYYQ